MGTQYRVMQAEVPKALPRSLIQISGDRNFIASFDAFGPNSFNGNVAGMQEQYSHLQTGELTPFREPTTAESILRGAYNPKNLKSQILNPFWLQLGRIARWDDGVYILGRNVQIVIREGQLDPQVLRKLRDSAKSVGEIRLGERYFAFVPYGFKIGEQSGEEFARGNLAKGLEHVRGIASNLGKIASKENYPGGVYVWGFDSIEKPVLRVAGLGSSGLVVRRLYVGGNDDWLDSSGGYAFGAL
jgi:hypothetical protein